MDVGSLVECSIIQTKVYLLDLRVLMQLREQTLTYQAVRVICSLLGSMNHHFINWELIWTKRAF